MLFDIDYKRIICCILSVLLVISVISFYSFIPDDDSISEPTQINHSTNIPDNVMSMPLHKTKVDSTLSAITDWDSMLHEAGLDYLISSGFSGENVKIGIIDNGVDFLNSLFENTTYVEQSFASPGEESTEVHGTGVMGMVVGIDSNSGTAKKATIISAEMGSDPSDKLIVGDIISAFEWLIYDQNVSIINTSWGGPINIWDDILSIAEEENVIIVGSAGNDGSDSYIGGPGAHLSSISVGSISNEKNISSFSSIGPTISNIMKPDLVTFGEEVLTASVGGGVSLVSGTSYSSGFVSGGIATLISALNAVNIPYTPSMIKTALLASATDLGYNYLTQGSGLVNFTAAYQLIIDSSSDLIHAHLYQSDFYNGIPEKVTEIFPLTVSMMCGDNLVITMDGNLSSILLIEDDVCGSVMPITLHTKLGYFEGHIVISINSVVRYNILYSINIDTELKGSILLDWYYNGGFFGYEFARFEEVPQHLLAKTIKSIRLRNDLNEQVPTSSTWERFIYKLN